VSQEPRTNSTTFRYSETVQDILNNEVPGISMADKIEYICLDYRKEKEIREKSIKDLDKQIKNKQNQLSRIIDKIQKFDNVADNLEALTRSIEKCNT
jgi:intergrase/recombinase